MFQENIRDSLSQCLTLICFCLSRTELRSGGCDLGEIVAVGEDHLEIHQRHTLGNSEDLSKL